MQTEEGERERGKNEIDEKKTGLRWINKYYLRCKIMKEDGKRR